MVHVWRIRLDLVYDADKKRFTVAWCWCCNYLYLQVFCEISDTLPCINYLDTEEPNNCNDTWWLSAIQISFFEKPLPGIPSLPGTVEYLLMEREPINTFGPRKRTIQTSRIIPQNRQGSCELVLDQMRGVGGWNTRPRHQSLTSIWLSDITYHRLGWGDTEGVVLHVIICIQDQRFSLLNTCITDFHSL